MRVVEGQLCEFLRSARLLEKCQAGVEKTCCMTSRMITGHGLSIVILPLRNDKMIY